MNVGGAGMGYIATEGTTLGLAVTVTGADAVGLWFGGGLPLTLRVDVSCAKALLRVACGLPPALVRVKLETFVGAAT